MPQSSGNSSVVIDEGSAVPQSSGYSFVLINEGPVAPNELANQEMIGKSLDPVPQSSGNSYVLIDEGSVAQVLPDSGWPFVKRSVHWKTIESMEVFRKIPQKPHFQPLSRSKEAEREGMAISYMVTFCNVVERCCSLKIRDPKCVVEDLNLTLLKLETHGFDLAMVRDCLMKFLEAKDKEEKLVQEGKDIHNQIGEHMYNKIKFDRDIEVMNEHIRRLQEQIELARIGNTYEVQQIANLQTKLDQILQQLKCIKCDFKALTASLL